MDFLEFSNKKNVLKAYWRNSRYPFGLSFSLHSRFVLQKPKVVSLLL